jgi:hypothetical protein
MVNVTLPDRLRAVDRDRRVRVAAVLLLTATVCAVVTSFWVGRASIYWSDDVSINAPGPLKGHDCGYSVYGVITAGPIYGITEGGVPESRDPAYEAACAKAARPEWEEGKDQLRVALPFAVIGIILTVLATYAWWRREPPDPDTSDRHSGNVEATHYVTKPS